MMTSTNDITEIFQERIGNRLFGSLEEFNHLLAEFSKVSGTHYSVRTSKRNRGGDVTFMKYICQRKGFALKPSHGLRHQTPTTTDCEAYFNVGRIGASFRISNSNMVHNHELQTGKAGSWNFRNRRLTPSELEIIRPMLECGDSAFKIRHYVKSRFQKNLTGCDVVNMRRQVLVGRNNPAYIRRMESELNVNGKAQAMLDVTNKHRLRSNIEAMPVDFAGEIDSQRANHVFSSSLSDGFEVLGSLQRHLEPPYFNMLIRGLKTFADTTGPRPLPPFVLGVDLCDRSLASVRYDNLPVDTLLDVDHSEPSDSNRHMSSSIASIDEETTRGNDERILGVRDDRIRDRGRSGTSQIPIPSTSRMPPPVDLDKF